MEQGTFNTEIPTDIEYIPGSTERFAKSSGGGSQLKATSKEEIYQGVITEAERSVSGFNGNLQLALSIETTSGARIKHWVTVPVANPNIAGHSFFDNDDTRSKVQSRCRELVSAVLGADALPAVPRKNKTTDVYEGPAGEAMSKGEVSAAFREANDTINAQVAAWYRNPSELVGTNLFFGTYMSKDGKYARVQFLRSDSGDRNVL